MQSTLDAEATQKPKGAAHRETPARAVSTLSLMPNEDTPIQVPEPEAIAKWLAQLSPEARVQVMAMSGVSESAAAQSVSGHAAASRDDGFAQAATVIINVFHSAGSDVTQREASALAHYLRVSTLEWRRLPLAGIDPDHSDAESLAAQTDLQNVYIGLNVVEPRPDPRGDEKSKGRSGKIESGRSEAWTALEATTHFARSVILGDPGSGKSTFLRMLAIELADDFRQSNAPTRGRAAARRFGSPHMPVFVTLRDFAASRTEGQPQVRLARFIETELNNRGLGDAFQVIERFLREGRAILLLDGLDEIADAAQRDHVLESITAFATRHEQTRIIVTCRVAAYTRREHEGPSDRTPDWRLPNRDFPVLTLAPFTPKQSEQFIDAWYTELKRKGRLQEDPIVKSMSLRRALARSDIKRLSSNPLLLTVMAIVHGSIGELPDQRVHLYQYAVDTLLRRWRQGREPVAPSGEEPRSVAGILAEAKANTGDLEFALWGLAKRVHASTAGTDKDAVADITLEPFTECLQKLHPERSLPWASRLIEAISKRSGLLVERRHNVFTFAHRTFQEYLAARELANSPAFADDAFALCAAPSDLWREVILMAGGSQAHLLKGVPKVLPLVRRLVEIGCRRGSAADTSHALILAADLVAEMTPARVQNADTGAALVSDLQRALLRTMHDASVDHEFRAALGSALGRVGDPRPGVVTLAKSAQGVSYPDLHWSDCIPAGPFPMGNDAPEAKWDDEKPRFECALIALDYAISRYPITVAQFDLFVRAGGYQSHAGDRFWTESGLAWKNKHAINGPATYADVFQTPNHPQVGVSWYEAVAFCRWLAEVSGRPIRLPTEPEWERAARHTDARTYPWASGDEAEAGTQANFGNAVGHTTPVGLYPRGAAPCGAEDLSGNVVEWCSSCWTKDYRGYDVAHDQTQEGERARVVRGGSCFLIREDARAAYRSGFLPDLRLSSLGFRVCVSPFSHSAL